MGADPTGTFLYVSNNASASISGYRINEGGVLTALPNSPFPLPNGASPTVLVVVPRAKHGSYPIERASTLRMLA